MMPDELSKYQRAVVDSKNAIEKAHEQIAITVLQREIFRKKSADILERIDNLQEKIQQSRRSEEQNKVDEPPTDS